MRLSEINQSKPVNLESKGDTDITFNDDLDRQQSSGKKQERIDQKIEFDAESKKDALKLDFFQFDNAESAPVPAKEVKTNKPALDDFAFEFDDGGVVQNTQEN